MGFLCRILGIMATAKAATKKAPKKAATKKVPAKAATKKTSTKAAKGADGFAVIETGGKQYIVSVGDVIDVELLGEHAEGDSIEFDQVLLTDDGKETNVGDPYIKGATVKATYKETKKGKKLSIIRFESKSNRDRKVGHRQKYARVEIVSL